VVAFGFAIAACLVAAGASWMRGKKYVHPNEPADTTEEQPQADDVEAVLR
jgi:hypothetical protein